MPSAKASTAAERHVYRLADLLTQVPFWAELAWCDAEDDGALRRLHSVAAEAKSVARDVAGDFPDAANGLQQLGRQLEAFCSRFHEAWDGKAHFDMVRDEGEIEPEFRYEVYAAWLRQSPVQDPAAHELWRSIAAAGESLNPPYHACFRIGTLLTREPYPAMAWPTSERR